MRLRRGLARGLYDDIRDDAEQRVRPKVMTVSVVLAGLRPIT